MLLLNVLEEKILFIVLLIIELKKCENDIVFWVSLLVRLIMWGGDMVFCSDGLVGVFDVGDFDL